MSTAPAAPAPAAPAPAAQNRRRVWALVAVVALVVVPLVYAAAVLTRVGQRVEDAALQGVRESDLFGSDTVLNVISLPVILLLVVVIIAVAFARGRLGVGIGAAVVVLAAAGTSTLLKDVAARPEIAGSTTPNSFPSGHATIALAALFAVLMVTPRRLRPFIMLVGAAYVVLVANQTVVYGWHRVSDIIGACGVALFWVGVVRAFGPGVDRGTRGDRIGARGPRRLVTAAMVAALGVCLTVGVFALVFTLVESDDRSALLVAGRMAASGSVVASLLVAWLADGMHHAHR